MPELPDITLYLHALDRHVKDHALKRIIIRSPSLLRSFDPPLECFAGLRVHEITRNGKRLVLAFEEAPGKPELFLVIHLMIAGRLRWLEGKPAYRPAVKIDQAVFQFDHGALVLTEAAQMKRATLTAVRGALDLAAMSRGGLDLFQCSLSEFVEQLRHNAPAGRTIKRVLTSPAVIDGIGNAYSDEILHAARLSPFKRISAMTDEECAHLFDACRSVLSLWRQRLLEEFDDGRRFPGPGDVTAFRPDFAVHGKFNQPCPVCGCKVQRIVFAENEINYCPKCQTRGRILADRSLSRLLRDEWPKRIEDLEEERS